MAEPDSSQLPPYKSIQWKTVIIFLLLILLAMQVIGAYLLQSLEGYYIENFAENLALRARDIGAFLQRYMGEDADVEYIQERLQSYGTSQRIFLVDENGIVIASSQEGSPLVGQRLLLRDEVSAALGGQRAGAQRVDNETGEQYYHLAVPIVREGTPIGAVYMIASLSDIYATLGDIKTILFSATLLALSITAILGFLLARTITGPIREITEKAALMAGGDFDQQIGVKSEDEIGRLASMFNYLTKRLKETIGEMENEKRKVEAIVTHMADGILALNRQRQLILMNQAAEEMLGADARSVNDRDLRRVFPQLDLTEEVEATLGGEANVTTQLQIEEPEERILRAEFAPIKQSGEEGVVIVLQDITEQQKLEEMRKEFVANVSHELRTPITTIKSYVETLRDGALEERQVANRFLEVVNSEANRMTRMIEDLLELSRMDYQRADWPKREVDMVELVEEVRAKLLPQARHKDQKVTAHWQEGIPLVYGNRDKIQQVLINIVGNAMEFTPEEGRIRIVLDHGEEEVTVRVIDNGAGIPQEDLPRIFERFYRVDKARSRRLGGSGLGLAIAREIVLAHGGTIDIESQVGEGTEVYFTLPTVHSTVAEGGDGDPTKNGT